MLKLKTKGRSGVGIYPKMLTGYMLIIAVVLSMTAFVTYRLVRNYIIQTNETELVEKAQYIAITQKNGLEWKQLRRYQSLVDAKVVFVNPDYIATQSPPSPTSRKTPDEEDAAGLAYTEIVSNMDRRIFDGIFAGGTVCGVEAVEFLTAKIVYAGVPLKDAQGEIIGAMMLFRTVADVDVVWMRIATYLIVAAACAMLSFRSDSVLPVGTVNTSLRPKREIRSCSSFMRRSPSCRMLNWITPLWRAFSSRLMTFARLMPSRWDIFCWV